MSEKRSIPSLDGIRALAILAVVFGHSRAPVLEHAWLLPFRNGSLGVVGFFVLSGFLITGILLREIDKTGGISLKNFYARRSFRIFPAFYLYLFVAAGLSFLHLYSMDWKSFIAAGTYTWNYSPWADSFVFSQTWSLSLEEQFYLLWPLCLCFFEKKTCFKIAVGSILLSPFSRMLTYALFPVLRGHINMMLHTHIDAILTGAALALAQNLGLFVGLRERLAKTRYLIPVIAYFAVQPFLEQRFGGKFSLPIGMTLDEFGWAIVVLHVVRYPKHLLGKFLNSPPIVHIGRISYSIYLWHVLFVVDYTRSFPLNLVWILLSAEASYWLVEQPFLRLRDRVVRSSTEKAATRIAPPITPVFEEPQS